MFPHCCHDFHGMARITSGFSLIYVLAHVYYVYIAQYFT
uniref:Uncharacterized protein n=1 Tax=Anguilla anguilla TaxID=7936 RepID=A0A0E9T6B2_ANGAN